MSALEQQTPESLHCASLQHVAEPAQQISDAAQHAFASEPQTAWPASQQTPAAVLH
jgi:hypothetical protein